MVVLVATTGRLHKKLSRRSKLPGSWKLGAYTLVSWEPELPTNAG